jgi:8-oxo-dGTP pyrophosphatase MutT (NUDIX family)
MRHVISKKPVFRTPWFSISAKTVDHDSEPYYALECPDYVAVCAVTTDDRILLVEQYRPAVESTTLEFVCGHVEAGETPEEAARRELLEETGFEAARVEPLGALVSDTGRLANRLWCFYAQGATPSHSPASEDDLAVVEVTLPELLAHTKHDGRLNQAFSLALLFLLCRSGKLGLGIVRPDTRRAQEKR